MDRGGVGPSNPLLNSDPPCTHPDRLLGVGGYSVSGRPLLVLGPSAEWGWEEEGAGIGSNTVIYLVPIEIQLTRGNEGVRLSD
ncbi:hypothetical protein PENSUB_12106 [Penicillium subrubescens]|jgi:hypothetical protein|uniref:Uncharacterized protein n=1 Tax=Penicillium subrubescens TaxID=1316194 RepID=A0A1Q5T0M7_9EURO|nr:hypothetical protein PENSUB_12106 [Penicillium subrubescens]